MDMQVDQRNRTETEKDRYLSGYLIYVKSDMYKRIVFSIQRKINKLSLHAIIKNQLNVNSK